MGVFMQVAILVQSNFWINCFMSKYFVIAVVHYYFTTDEHRFSQIIICVHPCNLWCIIISPQMGTDFLRLLSVFIRVICGAYFYIIIRLIPCFMSFTLKFSKSPSFNPDNFKYVITCAVCIGAISFTAFNSRITWLFTNKSIRYPASNLYYFF